MLSLVSRSVLTFASVLRNESAGDYYVLLYLRASRATCAWVITIDDLFSTRGPAG